ELRVFFFSSRRRHTRLVSDWSSDVCSSDLAGTIRENVAFSRPLAANEAIVEACRIARVNEFADRFPGGLDTVVGERGVKLSGGQIGRASCRERVGDEGGGGTVEKKRGHGRR